MFFEVFCLVGECTHTIVSEFYSSPGPCSTSRNPPVSRDIELLGIASNYPTAEKRTQVGTAYAGYSGLRCDLSFRTPLEISALLWADFDSYKEASSILMLLYVRAAFECTC